MPRVLVPGWEAPFPRLGESAGAGPEGAGHADASRHPRGRVGVEVKSPFRERPPGEEAWSGHDGELLAQCLDKANEQFSDEAPNILVLVPSLRTPVSVLRTQLVEAFYGREKVTCTIDTRTGESVGPVSVKFFPEGRFLRRRLPNGPLVKPDGAPGYTRLSAALVIEEKLQYDSDGAWIDHAVLVAHNPHARRPLSSRAFDGFVQFTDLQTGWGWNDGEPL